jgi:molybdate/tungstate transport system substrate-binding protein
MKSIAFLVAGTLAVAASSARTASAAAIRVAYAGSMGAVMDQQIGPAFEKMHDVTYQGVGQGSYALAHLLASKQMRADVFISITPGPMRILIKGGLIKQAIPVASTQMVIAYSRKSRFADEFEAEPSAKEQWYKVLELKGVRFGRTDPATDPQGQNIIFTFILAERYYHQLGLAAKILGPWRNPAQMFTEPSLLARLESGQLDASSGYLSAVLSQHLPYISLPPQINLADPSYFDSWYSKAGFTFDGPNGRTINAKPQPLVFYAAVLANAENPSLAANFVEFISGEAGQKLLRNSGYNTPLGGSLNE